MIPKGLLPYNQFINYDSDKRPYDPIRYIFPDHLHPENQLTAEEAVKRATHFGLGVGFVFTDNDPFFFLDIDHAFNNSKWSELSTSLCQYFTGCYCEVSMSGTGCHIMGSSTSHDPHRCKNKENGLELYTKDRYVALTGCHAVGDVRVLANTQLEWLISNYFQPTETQQSVTWTTCPVPEWNGPVDDSLLLKKMLASKSPAAVFGGHASPADLWYCNTDILSTAYPHEDNEFDLSSADAALIAHLMFWTGKDCNRAERLFSMSGLVRDKWIDRSDYRQRTILNAAARCQNVFGQGAPAVAIAPQTVADNVTTIGPSLRSPVFQFQPVDHQLEFFKGCVHVRDEDRILVPDGGLLNKSLFNTQFGGWVFAMDAIGDKTTTEAWKVFTTSQAIDFPKVMRTGFHPKESPGAVIRDDIGHTEVNVYVPAAVASAPGDVSRFTNHLEKLIPDENDRKILLAYMAAVVQHVGEKFFWCPLIQGTEGNGKSLIANCLRHAVSTRYTHEPRAKEIGEKYNSWMVGKLLIIVEEINVAGKFELMDVLKTLITAEHLEIRKMNTDQVMAKVCANFVMFSNFKDAVIKTADNRRNSVFYTAQQTRGDIVRDGMGAGYFPELYKWLRSGGYAYVTHYLQNYIIPPELNPATGSGGKCHRAPTTTSTAEAIRNSFGNVEQEIEAATEEGHAGFMGGWISSVKLSEMLDRKRLNKSRRRRKDMLETMGYIPHPGLTGGQVRMPVISEGGKRPTLYITVGHPSQYLTDGGQILAEYLKAQGVVV